MAFTVRDYHDLVRLLAEHPEWQLELRRLLISEDLQALPGIVRDLAEAQRRTEQRVAELAEAQRRSEERLGRLEETVAALAEAQQRTEQRVAELAEAQRRTEQRVAELAEAQRRSEERLSGVEERVGHLVGRSLEQDYREKTPAYFGRLLRRPRAIGRETLDEVLEASLSAEELNEVLLLDLVVRGQPRLRPEISEAWLAVEVSAVVDREDVERAQRRAALLRKAGYPAIPVVAGERLTTGAEREASAASVAVLQDGQVSGWEETLAALE